MGKQSDGWHRCGRFEGRFLGFPGQAERDSLLALRMSGISTAHRDLKKFALRTALGLVVLVALALAALHFIARSGLSKSAPVVDQYLAAYLMTQEAEKDRAAGREATAAWKLYKVRVAVGHLKSEHPGWEPNVVDYRQKETQKQFWGTLKDLVTPWK